MSATRNFRPAFAGLMSALAVAGCESLRGPDRANDDVVAAGAGWAPSIEDAERLLGDGDAAAATALLRRISAADGAETRAAERYLAQLTVAPERYFADRGDGDFEHRVAAGETLSQIARRYLGSADQFVALARYNGIERPRDLAEGDIVLVPGAVASARAVAPEPLVRPLALIAEKRFAEALKALAEVNAGDAGTDPAAVQDMETRAWCGAAETAADDPDPFVTRALFRCAQSRAATRSASEKFRALEMADAAYARDRDFADAAYLRSALRQELKPVADDWHESALQLFAKERYAEAASLWSRALLVDPGNMEARTGLATASERGRT